MQKALIFIGFLTTLTLGVSFGSSAIADVGRYEIVCNTDQENPHIRHLSESELVYDNDFYRMWYSIGLETFHPVEILMAPDGRQLLRGTVFDFRGRQTYLEKKQDGDLEYTFFVLASEWSCSLLDSHETTGGQ